MPKNRKPPKQLKMRARGLQSLFRKRKNRFRRPDADKYTIWSFQLTNQQARVARRWARMHMTLQCPHGKPDAYRGAIGGGITYKFTPTSIGILISVDCSCGASLYLGEQGGDP